MESGLLLVALADGAGSAECSDQGAQTAVDAALQAMEEWNEAGLPEDQAGWRCLLCSAFENARLAVEDLAAQQDQPLRCYASTLTCAALSETFLAAGQLGDGAVIAGEQADDLFSVHQAQRGEYANETNFLTQQDALVQVEFRTFDRTVNYLAVMSDGLIRLALKMPSYEPHLPFFGPLFDYTAGLTGEVEENGGRQADPGLQKFLTSERVNARTDDDKSLVLAVRVPSN